MSKHYLTIGGFTKIDSTLCNSTFEKHRSNDNINLTAEGNEYVVLHISEYHNIEYCGAVIFYNQKGENVDSCYVTIDGVKRKITPGNVVINDQGRLVVIDTIKPGKYKKVKCFLYRFIRSYNDHHENNSKDNNPYDTFTIKYHPVCNRQTYYDGDGEPVILAINVIKGNYKFINWYVFNTYTGYTIPPCTNGDDLFNLIFYIQDLSPPQKYAGNFNVGYICEDSNGKQHFVGQYFQQPVPNGENSEPINLPYSVNDPVEFPYIINYQQTS